MNVRADALSAGRLGAAAVVAALLTWGLQAVVGRVMGPTGYADFMVVWGLVFVGVALLQGLQQEVTRAVAADPDDRRDGRRVGRVGVLAAVVGIVGAAIVLFSSPAWGAHVLGAAWFPEVSALAFAFLTYAFYHAVNGALAGRRLWRAYATSMMAEGVLRALLVAAALLAGAHLGVLAWCLSGGGLTWMLLLARADVRGTLHEDGGTSLTKLASGASHAMVATGCSAILVTGFPVLLKVTTTGPLPAEAGIVLAAVTATRAPLLIPLNASQAFLLPRFVRAHGRPLRPVLEICGVIALVGLIGALAAYTLGPWLLQALYGGSFVIGGGLIALLVVAAALTAMQAISGTAVLALGEHRAYAGIWLASTVVAVVVLMSRESVGARACLALTSAALVGLLANLAVVVRGNVPR